MVDLNHFDGLRLSDEAAQFLEESELTADGADEVRFMIAQELCQEAFWGADVRATDAQIVQMAREREVSADLARKAVDDLLIPERASKRQFLNELALSGIGKTLNMDQLSRAYKLRVESESEHGIMTFNAEDLAPFRTGIVELFTLLWRAMKDGNSEVKVFMKRMLRDFGRIDGVDLTGWFGKYTSHLIGSDMIMYEFQEYIRRNPGELDNVVKRFIEGEADPVISFVTGETNTLDMSALTSAS